MTLMRTRPASFWASHAFSWHCHAPRVYHPSDYLTEPGEQSPRRRRPHQHGCLTRPEELPPPSHQRGRYEQTDHTTSKHAANPNRSEPARSQDAKSQCSSPATCGVEEGHHLKEEVTQEADCRTCRPRPLGIRVCVTIPRCPSRQGRSRACTRTAAAVNPPGERARSSGRRSSIQKTSRSGSPERHEFVPPFR